MKLVLDFGAGDRRFARVVELFMTGCIVVGLDKQPRERHYLLDKFKFESGKKVPYSDGFFDKVTALSSLQYINDLDGLFDEFSRVLKPGGEFFITYPYRWHPYNLWHCDKIKGYKYCDKALWNAGFSIVEKGLFGGGSYVIVKAVKKTNHVAQSHN